VTAPATPVGRGPGWSSVPPGRRAGPGPGGGRLRQLAEPQQVDAGIVDAGVHRRTAVDDVVAALAEQPVVATATVDGVRAVTAADRVVVVQAADRVVSTAPGDHVPEGSADQRVVPGATEEGDVLTVARERRRNDVRRRPLAVAVAEGIRWVVLVGDRGDQVVERAARLRVHVDHDRRRVPGRDVR
jgi:hypothetical protein